MTRHNFFTPLYRFEWRNFGNVWLMRFPQVLVGFAACACMQGAVAGLFVARLSPAQPLPMVMTVTTVVRVASIIVGASAVHGAPAPVPPPLLLFWIGVNFVLTPVGIVAGGRILNDTRGWGRIEIDVDGRSYEFIVPSSVCKYTHGHAPGPR